MENHLPIREKFSTSVDLPLSHETSRVLAFAAEESQHLNHQHIGTGHLLVGLLREEKCFAAEISQERGLQLSTISRATEVNFGGLPMVALLRNGSASNRPTEVYLENYALIGTKVAFKDGSRAGLPTVEDVVRLQLSASAGVGLAPHERDASL